MSYETRWIARTVDYRDSVELAHLQTIDGERFVAEAMLTQKKVEPGMLIEKPTLTIPPHEAQQIMNELWREGFRPNDGVDSIAHQNAVAKHLQDMRRIAFAKLKVDEPD